MTAWPRREAWGRNAPHALRRVLWWCVVVAVVLLVHAALTHWLDDALGGWDGGHKPMPARLEVAFVKALTPTEPSPPAPAARPIAGARKSVTASPAARPASQPERPPVVAEAEPDIAPEAAEASLELPEPPAVSPPKADGRATAAAAADLASQPGGASPSADIVPSATGASAAEPVDRFEWPPSTRITFALTGNYRGEVHGNATVQWVRQGPRYQVHLDVTIGASFAPLISRRMTSDGLLGANGLTPRRYDEITRLPFQNPRRASIEFTPDQVTLANGIRRDALAGVQDSASQFVQLTWLFTTQPERLRVGNAITMPLALPRRMDHWIYDVVGEERLNTPVGSIETYHLRPRRADDRPRGELSAEVWIAPSLQYLPARIRIQQDADTFVDLMLDSAPMQEVPESLQRY